MTFEVEVSGRTRSVTIERAGDARQYRVLVDRTSYVLDVARVEEFGLSITGTAACPEGGSAGRESDAVPFSRELQVTPGTGRAAVFVSLEGRLVTAAVNGRRTGRAAIESGAHAHGDQGVIAPMPGRVVRVLVARGDEVAAGQPVVVVEAMKMENELRAPKAGRVTEVNVTPGVSVHAGKALVVIE